jgi:uncharacterized membrane protein
MRISDLLQMNDWEIKKFISVVLVFQLAMLIMLGLGQIGIQVPILRQVIGFIYLTFIPGSLILRILKLHKLNVIETQLYTIGLSIITVMSLGVFINTIIPYFGYSSPISTVPLAIAISTVIFVLCFLCYVIDRGFSAPAPIEIKDINLPPMLFLLLLPFLAIFGTSMLNFYHTNVLLFLLLFIIAFIAILVVFDKFIPKRLFPLAIFVTSVSLLFHNSLVSAHIIGYDIQLEYYITSSVLTSGYWNPSIYGYLNSMLSIVMLAPIYSLILNMDIIWVFKIIYPLLFSLVPLGLYRVFQKQMDEKAAFMSAFFFIAMAAFYTEMLYLARQQVAELFLVLLLLLIVNNDMEKMGRSTLFIIFSLSLVISHYGLTYIFAGSIIVVLILLYLGNKSLPLLKKEISFTNKLSVTLVIPFFIFTLVWYLYTSGSSAFLSIVVILDQIINNIFTSFLNPENVQGLAIISANDSSDLLRAFKYMHIFTQFCIVIGVVAWLLKSKKMKFHKEYSAFAIVNIMILVACLAVPFFASAINTTRLYQISLFFLAPFFVVGWVTILKTPTALVNIRGFNISINTTYKVLSLFLALYLLFNSGVVFELLKDSTPMSYSLNDTVDIARFNSQEVTGAKWIVNERGSQLQNSVETITPIYCDGYRILLLMGLDSNDRMISNDFNETPADSYVYYGTLNTIRNQVLTFTSSEGVAVKEYVNSTDLINGRGKIYTNGGTVVYN